MSGAGTAGWRRSGQANRQQNQERSGNNSPSIAKEGGRQPPLAASAGNVWGAGAKGKGGAPSGGGGAQQPPVAQVQPEAHVPVNDFNAAEVRDFLKKRYDEAVAGLDPARVHYKVQGDSVPKRSSGAWGSRGNMSHLMPNGRDFMAELKKQLQALEDHKTS